MAHDDETRQVAMVAERLTARHPGLPPESIAAMVREVHAGYAHSHVRDFVPLLVERGVRERLRRTSDHQHPGVAPDQRLVG